MTQHILIVDDDSDILSALSLLLKSEGYVPTGVTGPEQALDLLGKQEFALVLADLNYATDTTSGGEGLELISDIRKRDELTPLVVMTGWATIDVAVDSLKRGANDFLQKPWENERLLSIIKTQLELREAKTSSQKLQRQNQLLREEACQGAELVLASATIKQLMQTIEHVARSDASVLFTGENGTGKSFFARHLHQASLRQAAPFIAVNMGAIPDGLFESEMFGHVKGAFTDAKSSRIGRFELADKGSLFLDEIANIPYAQQGKLLRVLEEMQFEKVGASKTQRVNVRLITATNANLQQAVAEGEFRQDLLFRLNTVEIAIPPLRQRQEDILPLANSFLRKIAKKYGQPVLTLDKAAVGLLQTYPWPGNVRELSHVMERAHILCQDRCIGVHNLGLNIKSQHTYNNIGNGDNTKAETSIDATNSDASNSHAANKELLSLEQIEKNAIKQRLQHFNGDANKTAESLGLSRSAFYRRLGKAKLS